MTLPFESWLTPRQIEEKVVALVKATRQRFGIPVGCSATDACHRIGLEWKWGDLRAGTDGFWSDHLIVVNRSVSWMSRVEFTIFHEIMHFLLDEDGELIEFFTSTLRNDPSSYSAAIERCCNHGAAEFLMPEGQVRRLIADKGFGVSRVGDLTRNTGASLIAAAAQVAACAPLACFVAICNSGPIPKSFPPLEGLYVEYAFSSYHTKYVLARFTRIPNEHLIASVQDEEGVIRDTTFVPFRSGKRMPCECEVLRVGNRWVATFEWQKLHSPGQLSLPV